MLRFDVATRPFGSSFEALVVAVKGADKTNPYIQVQIGNLGICPSNFPLGSCELE